MEKVIDFRRHAEECRQLAHRSRKDDERKMLVAMAESWDSLAEVRERNLNKGR
jgi:hypothetical protein